MFERTRVGNVVKIETVETYRGCLKQYLDVFFLIYVFRCSLGSWCDCWWSQPRISNWFPRTPKAGFWTRFFLSGSLPLVKPRSAPSTMAGFGWAMLGMPKQWQNRRGASCVKATMYRIHTPRRCQVGQRRTEPNLQMSLHLLSKCLLLVQEKVHAHAIYRLCTCKRLVWWLLPQPTLWLWHKGGVHQFIVIERECTLGGYVLCQEPRKYITIYAGSVCIAKMNLCTA